MKRFLLALALVCVGFVAVAATVASTDSRTVLSTSTTNGVTTTLYIGRVQTDPAKDGTATLTVFPARVLTDSAGNVISDTPVDAAGGFSVKLTADQYASIAAIVKAAYTAQQTATP